MKILLFGARGRLGGAFLRVCTSHTFVTPSREDVDLSDTTSIAKYIESLGSIDFLINTTAYNAVDLAEGDGRKEAEEVNVQIPKNLAEVASAHKIPFLHISTDYVFDGAKQEGYTEAEEPHPLNVYGQTKRDGERAVIQAHPDAMIARVSRLFGLRAASPNAKKDFIEIVKMKQEQQEVMAFFDRETSCPTYVDDVARHVEAHLFSGDQKGVFHLANQGACTWYTWAIEIVKQLGVPAEVVRRTDTPTRAATIPQFTELLSTRLPPMRSWQDALKEYLAQT